MLDPAQVYGVPRKRESEWIGEKYRAGTEEVMCAMEKWGMSSNPEMYDDAEYWCQKLKQNRRHAKGVYFPGTEGKKDGVYVATSTPSSMQVAEYHRDLGSLIVEEGMEEPDYL